jgi:hypothetical protein
MSLEAFQNHFYSEFNRIVQALDELQLDPIKSEQEQKASLMSSYETVSNRVEILKKYFTENTSFIPNFEVRKAQESVNKLNRLMQEKRDVLFPKKKFGFKSKQNMTTLEAAIETASSKVSKPEQKESETFDSFKLESSCNIRDLNDSNVVKKSIEINGKDVAIVNIKNSTIQLCGNPTVIHVNNVENSFILSGTVTGSVFINNCQNCQVVVPCHQLRIHETLNTHFYINVASRAIIENCKNVQFAPYNWSYPIENSIKKLDDPLETSPIVNWQSIDDFNWLNQNEKSPNWCFLDESQRKKWSTDENGRLHSN